MKFSGGCPDLSYGTVRLVMDFVVSLGCAGCCRVVLRQGRGACFKTKVRDLM